MQRRCQRLRRLAVGGAPTRPIATATAAGTSKRGSTTRNSHDGVDAEPPMEHRHDPHGRDPIRHRHRDERAGEAQARNEQQHIATLRISAPENDRLDGGQPRRGRPRSQARPASRRRTRSRGRALRRSSRRGRPEPHHQRGTGEQPQAREHSRRARRSAARPVVDRAHARDFGLGGRGPRQVTAPWTSTGSDHTALATRKPSSARHPHEAAERPRQHLARLGWPMAPAPDWRRRTGAAPPRHRRRATAIVETAQLAPQNTDASEPDRTCPLTAAQAAPISRRRRHDRQHARVQRERR